MVKLRTNKIISIGLVIILIISGMLFVFEFSSEHPTVKGVVTVDQAGNGDYLTIQEGIDNAVSGETVYVWNGIYNENITIHKNVELIGNGSATTIINASGLNNNAINITVEGVEITGLKIISNVSWYAIYTTSGGFNIHNNNIKAQGGGINVTLKNIGRDLSGSASVSVGNMEIDSNNITAVNDSICLDIRKIGYNLSGSAQVQLGAINITRNTIIANRGINMSHIEYLGYGMNGTSSFTWGGLYVSDNVINAARDGIIQSKVVSWSEIHFGYWGYYLNDSASCVIGDISFSNNTINASNDGIQIFKIKNLARFLTDNANATFGNFLFNDNDIEAGNYGIFVREISYLAHSIFGNSTAAFGNFLFNNNAIEAGNHGIYNLRQEYFAYNTYDNSTATFGNFEYNQNNISSTNHGIYIDDALNDCGHNMYDYSSASFGHLQTNHNNITSGGRGIYYDYFADTGSRIHDNTYFQMDNFEICHNIIDSGDDGIYVNSIYDLAYFMYNDSIAIFGDFLFTDNIINANGDGIYVNNFWYVGRYLYSNAIAFIGNVGITNNEIIAGGQGIYFRYQRCGSQLHGNSIATFGFTQINYNNITAGLNGTYFFARYLGHEMYNDSNLEMGNIEICVNTINASGDGIRIYRIRDVAQNLNDYANASFGDFLFNDNTIVAGNYGIYNDDFEYLARTMYGYSMATFGNFEFNSNNISSTNHGIYLDDTLNDCGNNMYDYSSAIFGHLQVNHNNITSGGYGIWYDYFADNGAYNRDHSYVQWDNFEIRHNIIDSGDDGIYIFSIYDLGYQLNNDSIAVFGDFLFIDNIIKSNGDGIYINNFNFIGRYLRSNASAYFGNIEINNNEINASGEGLHLRCQRFLTHLYGKASVVFGQILMNANNITSGMNAINFSALYYGQATYDNCTANAGIIQIDGNNVIAGEKGIYIYFFNVYYEIFNNSYLSFEDIMISNNMISALTIGIEIQYEKCGDLYHTSTAYLPGIKVLGNWVESPISAFNYTTKNTPFNNDPGATQVWNDMILEGNDFEAGVYGAVIDWRDPMSTVAQPEFHISDTNIHNDITGSNGLLFNNITHIYADNVTIDTFDYGISAINSSIHNMVNSSLSNCAVMDLNLNSKSYIFMVNSTFNNSNVFYSDTDSMLEVGWFMNVLVQNEIAIPKHGASVSVDDVDTSEIFNGTTDANGQANYIICTHYLENITGIIKNFNNYTANAALTGYEGVAVTNITMDQNRQVIITLHDIITPGIIWIERPTTGTTGESVLVSIRAIDNDLITYFKINIDGNMFDLVKDGDYYNYTIDIPLNSTTSITYNITINDTGNNINVTANTMITVIDNDLPTYTWVFRPTAGTTGETAFVSLMATDNIGIHSYKIDIDGTLYDMVKEGDYYNYTINIPSDSLTSISYKITINDSANNINFTEDVIIIITDNDAPKFNWLSQPTEGTTGESVVVSLSAIDNIDLTYYKINIDGKLNDLVKDGTNYNFTIDIPSDSVATISFYIVFNDSADNPNTTGSIYMIITDNDAPEFTWILQPTTGNDGESVLVSLKAYDNIEISEHIIYLEGTPYYMVSDGNYYNYTIELPIGKSTSISYYCKFNDSTGNSITTAKTEITISLLDREPPTLIWVSRPTTGTTGESGLVSLIATDNKGVTHYKINIDDIVYDMVKEGDYYNYTINFPSNSIEVITYFIVFNDTANNKNITLDTIISVTDNDAPTNLVDTSNKTATTGDTFALKVDAVDNIGITKVKVEYKFGNGTSMNATLSGTGPYTTDITIPSDSLDTLYYHFEISDDAGNWLKGTEVEIKVSDNDPSEVSKKASDTTGKAGEEFKFQIDVSDNIGVKQVKVAYWFGENEAKKEFLTLTETEGTYSGSVKLDDSGTMNYYFEVTDEEGNILESEIETVDVAPEKKDEEEMNMLLLILLIIVLVIIIIGFLFFISKSKKDEEPVLDEEMEEELMDEE